jgi:hypothetical protein
MKIALFIATLLLFATQFGGAASSAASCAIEPPSIEPIAPIGCKKMKHVCVCDSWGNNCAWVWICVKEN